MDIQKAVSELDQETIDGLREIGEHWANADVWSLMFPGVMMDHEGWSYIGKLILAILNSADE